MNKQGAVDLEHKKSHRPEGDGRMELVGGQVQLAVKGVLKSPVRPTRLFTGLSEGHPGRDVDQHQPWLVLCKVGVSKAGREVDGIGGAITPSPPCPRVLPGPRRTVTADSPPGGR